MIVYSATAKTRDTFAKETGAVAVASLAELAAKLKPPRVDLADGARRGRR